MHSHSLHDSIHNIQHLPPEYRQGLSNHLPMALHALHGLGASAQRLHDFGRVYAQRFVDSGRSPHTPPRTTPRTTLRAASAQDWPPLRGQPDSFAVLRASFEAMLKSQGREATLRAALPDLWPGLAGAAFHGLIRTGHAVQGEHEGELAQALAYWAWRWQAMNPGHARQALLPPGDWTAALLAGGGQWRSSAGLISLRIAEVQRTPVYQQLAESLQPIQADLKQALRPLAAFAAQRYAQTRNFTVLHMVTAYRAVLALAPWLQDGPALRAELLRAYTAAYLSCGLAPHADLPTAPALDWPDAIAAAVHSDDDHIVKLVHACRDLQDHFGDGPWLDAACRALSARQA